MQSDVAKRIATMDRTMPEVLREVERVLEKKLSTLSSEDFTAAGGVDSIVGILNLVDRTSEKGIIEALEEDSPELAEDIKKKMFVFEDIVLLDDRSIQKVLREVDGQEIAKALKGVDGEVQEKIFKNMSKRAATMLKEDMEFMGPVRHQGRRGGPAEDRFHHPPPRGDRRDHHLPRRGRRARTVGASSAARRKSYGENRFPVRTKL